MKAIFLLSLCCAAFASAAVKMNVLFIISDDLRIEFGCYASTLAKSPNIDKAADRTIQYLNECRDGPSFIGC